MYGHIFEKSSQCSKFWLDLKQSLVICIESKFAISETTRKFFWGTWRYNWAICFLRHSSISGSCLSLLEDHFVGTSRRVSFNDFTKIFPINIGSSVISIACKIYIIIRIEMLNDKDNKRGPKQNLLGKQGESNFLI